MRKTSLFANSLMNTTAPTGKRMSQSIKLPLPLSFDTKHVFAKIGREFNE